MSRLRAWLAAGPLLADGAWGTELQKRGLPVGVIPDLWNLERPDRVAEVASAYADAGSRLILTNTFRSNPIALGDGLAAKTDELNRAGVRISRGAASRGIRVIGSMGPVGKILAAAEVEPEEVQEAFERQAGALADAGADALLLETFSDLEEARLALAAARRTGLPVILSFTFGSGRKHDRTMTGATVEQAAHLAKECGADAVGANCGLGSSEFANLCRRFAACCALPLWMKPNAGLPAIVEGQAVYTVSEEEFAGSMLAILEEGAGFVGGCCGTTPEMIRAVAARVRACVSS